MTRRDETNVRRTTVENCERKRALPTTVGKQVRNVPPWWRDPRGLPLTCPAEMRPIYVVCWWKAVNENAR